MSKDQAASFEHLIVIEPQKGWIPINFRELWAFRELLYFLAWRDVKVKYKQMALGVIWAVLQPVLTMVIFTVLFGRFAKMPSDGVPYPIFVFIGLLPWQYFAAVLGHSTNSIVSSSQMITKIYFPRLFMPASTAIAALLDLAIASTILGFMMVYYHVSISPGALLIPLLLVLAIINAVGFGMWFSALNVRYRDIQFAIPFIIQIWMFATPVIYPSSLFGDRYGLMLALNPMGGVNEAFRPAVLGHLPFPRASLAISSTVGIMVFVSGMFYFRRVERYFSDVI